jgi:hypothetical protein
MNYGNDPRYGAQYGYGAPQPKKRGIPTWVIVIGSVGAIVIVLVVLLAIGVAGRQSRPRATQSAPATKEKHETTKVSIDLVTMLRPDQVVGEERVLFVTVKNRGGVDVNGVDIQVHATADLTWKDADADVAPLGLFDAARVFRTQRSIAPGADSLFKLTFVPSSPGPLTFHVRVVSNDKAAVLVDAITGADVVERELTATVKR